MEVLDPPIAVPSIVPPLISMVVTAPPFETVAPLKLIVPPETVSPLVTWRACLTWLVSVRCRPRRADLKG